jgi:ribulose bisphosphate carboxylase small subunit
MVNRIARPNDEIRTLILRYLYDRNDTATSARGKQGAAVTISVLRRELKEQQGLSREEVISNLRYLISQGWVEEQNHQRVVPTNGGRLIPPATTYYAITAAGIDRIEGPSEYTPRDRFAGIVNINASGQSTVTVGDGNQVNVEYVEPAEALATLAAAVKVCGDLGTDRKKDAIADIDTIQSQLARSEPMRTVITAAWNSIEPLGRIASLASLVKDVGEQICQFLN